MIATTTAATMTIANSVTATKSGTIADCGLREDENPGRVLDGGVRQPRAVDHEETEDDDREDHQRDRRDVELPRDEELGHDQRERRA